MLNQELHVLHVGLVNLWQGLPPHEHVRKVVGSRGVPIQLLARAIELLPGSNSASNRGNDGSPDGIAHRSQQRVEDREQQEQYLEDSASAGIARDAGLVEGHLWHQTELEVIGCWGRRVEVVSAYGLVAELGTLVLPVLVVRRGHADGPGPARARGIAPRLPIAVGGALCGRRAVGIEAGVLEAGTLLDLVLHGEHGRLEALLHQALLLGPAPIFAHARAELPDLRLQGQGIAAEMQPFGGRIHHGRGTRDHAGNQGHGKQRTLRVRGVDAVWILGGQDGDDHYGHAN
mmetsp:Transcript_92821/g.258527  ORF Transcript_92821/g.258527 Transcript_92821/m.258527 type:complete len:288 (-) Transcript_92821:1493-2356(-)